MYKVITGFDREIKGILLLIDQTPGTQISTFVLTKGSGETQGKTLRY